MPQPYYPVLISPQISTSGAVSVYTNSHSGTLTQIILPKYMKEEKPVEIIDGKIEINEDLIKENEIQSVKFNNQTYYVRKIDKAIEIFQLEE
jgi:hypothetical protein